VMEDIAARHERRVLIVTDGYVGPPSESDVATLRELGVELHTLLPAFGYDKDLGPYSTIHQLALTEAD
jgi:hypothetical protein